MAKEKTIKMTFKQMREFNQTWKSLVEATPILLFTKFGYAVKGFMEKNIIPVFTEYNSLLVMIRIEHALENPTTKAVLIKQDGPNGRGFEYGKEGLKAVIKAETDLEKEWDIKEYKVEPMICKDLPRLNKDEKEVFAGYVI